jgi:hypothetical protein
MTYKVRRKNHPYWRFLAAGLAAPRSIAIRLLAEQPDGAEEATSHVGLKQVRDDLVIYYGEDEADWPVVVTPFAEIAAPEEVRSRRRGTT